MQTREETRRQVRDNLSFFRRAIRRPGSIGAVMPSGKSLAGAMAAEIDPEVPGHVVELGAGTGNITSALLDRGIPARDLVVIEREPELCQVIARRFPELRVLQGNAARLGGLLRGERVLPIKAVVSGLPLLSIPKRIEESIIAEAFSVLADQGIFIQFTYGPLAPIARSVTNAQDLVAHRSEWVLDNVPPAAVWVYRRRPVGNALDRAV